jgi:hypothetical protein
MLLGWISNRLTDNTVEDRSPSIAVTGIGGAHVTYQQHDGSDYEIHYAVFTGTWNYTQITNDATSYSSPAIALDGDCEAHVVYEGNGVHHASSAVGWSSSTVTSTVSSLSLSLADRPIAIDGAGHAEIVYTLLSNTYHAVSDSSVGVGPGTCCLPRLIGCGQQVYGDTTGHATYIDTYSCSPWPLDETGPESSMPSAHPDSTMSRQR